MSKNKKVFKVMFEDKEVELAVQKPNQKVAQKGEQVYRKAFREAVEGGAILRDKIEKIMIDQDLWDEDKQKKYNESIQKLIDGKAKLDAGGIKKSEAKQIALDMRVARWVIQQMDMDRNKLDLVTAEATAENARFNYWTSACTVYNDTGKAFFKDYDDYLSDEKAEISSKAASVLAKLIYDLEDDYQKKMPENAFLLEYKLCNDELHLVDKDGNLVDSLGRKVDKDGNLIDKDGKIIDEEGKVVVKPEFKPFLDDEDEK